MLTKRLIFTLLYDNGSFMLSRNFRLQKIGDLIQSLREMGKTIVLAEQNLHFCLGLADRAVVIDKGADVFVGTITELNDNADIKQRYLSV